MSTNGVGQNMRVNVIQRCLHDKEGEGDRILLRDLSTTYHNVLLTFHMVKE